jgi:hypothetical protein
MVTVLPEIAWIVPSNLISSSDFPVVAGAVVAGAVVAAAVVAGAVVEGAVVAGAVVEGAVVAAAVVAGAVVAAAVVAGDVVAGSGVAPATGARPSRLPSLQAANSVLNIPNIVKIIASLNCLLKNIDKASKTFL